MNKLERKFCKMATERGVAVSETDVMRGVGHFVDFMRAVNKLKANHEQDMCNFSPDFIRETRQRILAASANITPIRLCRTAANDRTA